MSTELVFDVAVPSPKTIIKTEKLGIKNTIKRHAVCVDDILRELMTADSFSHTHSCLLKFYSMQ